MPSHGTSLFGSSYAIDFVPVTDTGRTVPITISSLIRPEPPDRFVGYGRPILAPVDGTVLAAHDNEPDHPAYRGLPSIVYALTQARRAAVGWRSLAGNYVLIDSGGIIVAVCHLRQDSGEVRAGQQVQVGDVLGRCGNSGNSTEPHVHVQAVDSRDIEHANAVHMTFNQSLPANGEVVHAGNR